MIRRKTHMSSNSFEKSRLNKIRGTHRTMTSQLVKAKGTSRLVDKPFFFFSVRFFFCFLRFFSLLAFSFFFLLVNNLLLVIYRLLYAYISDQLLMEKEISTYGVCHFNVLFVDHISIYHSIFEGRITLTQHTSNVTRDRLDIHVNLSSHQFLA